MIQVGEKHRLDQLSWGEINSLSAAIWYVNLYVKVRKGWGWRWTPPEKRWKSIHPKDPDMSFLKGISSIIPWPGDGMLRPSILQILRKCLDA